MKPALPDLPRLLAGHDAVVVGARDAALRPACALAAGVAFSDEPGRVTAFLPEATSEAVLACLGENGQIAVVFEEILSHHTIQLKGRVVAMRPAAEDERAVVEKAVEGFFRQVEAVGGAPGVVRRRRRWPCRAVTFEVSDVFEQTPGPRAGNPFVASEAP